MNTLVYSVVVIAAGTWLLPLLANGIIDAVSWISHQRVVRARRRFNAEVDTWDINDATKEFFKTATVAELEMLRRSQSL